MLIFFGFVLKLSQPLTQHHPLPKRLLPWSAHIISKIHLQCCHRNMVCDTVLVQHLINPLLSVFVLAQLDFVSGHSDNHKLWTQKFN